MEYLVNIKLTINALKVQLVNHVYTSSLLFTKLSLVLEQSQKSSVPSNSLVVMANWTSLLTLTATQDIQRSLF